jgi:hypothetical protein
MKTKKVQKYINVRFEVFKKIDKSLKKKEKYKFIAAK